MSTKKCSLKTCLARRTVNFQTTSFKGTDTNANQFKQIYTTYVQNCTVKLRKLSTTKCTIRKEGAPRCKLASISYREPKVLVKHFQLTKMDSIGSNFKYVYGINSKIVQKTSHEANYTTAKFLLNTKLIRKNFISNGSEFNCQRMCKQCH